MELRKIIHVDADCFYAAVEMRDQPSLANLPIAVGGGGHRGVVATCNYLARRYGVRSAMASSQAKRLCPDLVFVSPRMAVYRDVSKQIKAIFARYTDVIEPLSLDEAYLDVSHSTFFEGSATRIAEAIRADVERELSITVSAGVAPNKFLAKVASDWQKPNGLTVIRPAHIDAFVAQLAVSKIHGVGKVTAKKMEQRGWHTCADLRQVSKPELMDIFGKFGARLYDLCRGIDKRRVSNERQRKSLSVETTFGEDKQSLEECLVALPSLWAQFQSRRQSLGHHYKDEKAFVKLKFNDFTQTTLERAIETDTLTQFEHLLRQAFVRRTRPVRLMGIGVRFGTSDLALQLRLFT